MVVLVIQHREVVRELSNEINEIQRLACLRACATSESEKRDFDRKIKGVYDKYRQEMDDKGIGAKPLQDLVRGF